MAYEAFLQASAFCRPPSPRAPTPRPRQSLPAPTPPPTRLAGPRPLFDTPRSAAVAEEVQARPSSARAEVLSSKPLALPRPGRIERAILHMEGRQPKKSRVQLVGFGFDDDEANQKKQSKDKGRSLFNQVSDPYKPMHKPKACVTPEMKYERGKDARLLRQSQVSTRFMQNRIQAFDKRCDLLRGEAQHRLSVEANVITTDLLGGLLGMDKKPDLVRPDMPSLGEEVDMVPMRVQQDPLDELEEVPFKIVDCSSARASFPATNLIDTTSCWQSEIAKTQDQYVTIELEVMPIPIVAVQILPVTKDSCPWKCKVLCSNVSATGPWEEVWRLKVPEAHAEHGQPYLSRAPTPGQDEPEIVAPWWRLVVIENYGSEACIAVGGPLKLFSSQRCDRTLLKYYRKDRVSFLDVTSYHAAQDRNSEMLSPEAKMMNRMTNTYTIDIEFIETAYAQFLEADRQRFGVLSRIDWEHWMLQFLPAKDRPKIQPERISFFWRQVDKDDSNGVDFEEFLIFYNAIDEAAKASEKSISDFLFPGFGSKSTGKCDRAHKIPPAVDVILAEREQEPNRGLAEQDAIKRAARALNDRNKKARDTRDLPDDSNTEPQKSELPTSEGDPNVLAT